MIEAPFCQLSVVLAANHDSPDLREAIALHEAGLAEVGGELLIADGSQDGLPPDVRTAVHMPGADVFALRAAATKTAQGQIVAFTEDHCLPAPGWHSAVSRAHDENPNIAAVGGAVLNDSGESAIDWANFLATFGQFLPPLAKRHPSSPAPPANVSLKRASILEFDLIPGRLEMEIAPNMYFVNQMVMDDRVLVAHRQSRGIYRTIASHFHNGRSTAGLPYRRPPARELAVRTAHNLILPILLLTANLKVLARKPGYRRTTLRAFPMLVALACAHASGEIAGTLFGPGRSPKILE